MRERRFIKRIPHKAAGKPNITSLVDVALSLVIFFIVTLPLLLETGIFIKAPTMQLVSRDQPGTEFKVHIYLTEGGEYFLNEQSVTREELEDLTEKLLKRSIEKLAVIRADGAVVHERVVEVLDMVRQKGALKLALVRGKPMGG